MARCEIVSDTPTILSQTSAASGQSAFAPLTIPTFRAVWLGNLLSNFGGLVQTVGAAWLMTLIATSDLQVALVQASTTLPVMVFSLISGAVADSFDRRRVMLLAQTFMFVVAIALVLVAWFGLINAWLLLGLTFLLGCGIAFNNPAWQASVRDIVGMDHLPAAVLLNGVGFNVVRSVAPAIGGVIVATVGPVVAFMVNAFSYLGIIFAVWRWQGPPRQTSEQREPLRAAILSGIRYVRLAPNLRRLYARCFVFGLGAVTALALLPLIARDLLQGDSLTFGLLLGAFGFGAVIAGLSSARVAQHLSTEWMVRVAFLALLVGVLTSSVSVWFPLTALAITLCGWAWVLALAQFNTTVQLSTPRWVVGRAMAFYQMFAFGGMALGAWVWGMSVDIRGLPLTLQWSASILVMGLLIGLRWPLPSRRELNLDPLDRWKEPEVALDVVPRSGPVSVAIEYLIEEADIGEFLRLMAARQRIRRRDGARQWVLMRDVESPLLWIERFELSTWADYVRMHSRTTQEDAKVFDQIRALHKSPDKPRVRRLLVRDLGSI